MRKRFAATTLSLLLAGVLAGCRDGTTVEIAKPRRGEIVESFTEPARTRLARKYVVTMPIDGRIERIELEPGDRVTAGQELAAFDRRPIEQAVQEARSAVEEFESQIALKEDNRLEEIALEEANAAVQAAQEALKAADSQIDAERARYEHARREHERQAAVADSGRVSESELDALKLSEETALIELRKQEFTRAALAAVIVAVKLGPRATKEYMGRKKLERQVIVKGLQQARARLARAQYELELAEIKSPVDGVVLAKYEQGDGPVAAGTPLLELGNLEDLEVVADVLTQDALGISEGSKVQLTVARRRETIWGEVKRIEPSGFTKLSSLGVEQQRVKVIVALEEGIGGGKEALGVGYRLQARFLTGSSPNALVVPRYSVLQAVDGTHYVFKVVEGRLARQSVELGLGSDLELEVKTGLRDEDVIVAIPDATMRDGEKVRVEEPDDGGGEKT